MSIEAMAMAGLDYKECGFSLEKWNPLFPQQPPLYLVAVHEELVDLGAESMKAKIRKWAKAVASTSNQQSVTNHQCKLLVFS